MVGVQRFPGLAPNSARQVKNWGFAQRPRLGARLEHGFNTLRVGYTKIDDATGSACRRRARRRSGSWTTTRALTSTNGRQTRRTWNVTNDFSWIKGNHTVKVGTNLRFLRNERVHQRQFVLQRARQWLVGRWNRTALHAGWHVPGSGRLLGLPAVASGGQAAYADSFTCMLGAITQTTARYNYTIDGGVISEGRRCRACTWPTSTSSTCRISGDVATTSR